MRASGFTLLIIFRRYQFIFIKYINYLTWQTTYIDIFLYLHHEMLTAVFMTAASYRMQLAQVTTTLGNKPGPT